MSIENIVNPWSVDNIEFALDHPIEWIIFQYLDCDASGVIEESELKGWLELQGVDTEGQKIWDPDGDAITTFPEFCEVLENQALKSLSIIKQLKNKLPPLAENEVRITITFSRTKQSQTFGARTTIKNEEFVQKVAEVTQMVKMRFPYCLVVPQGSDKARMFDMHILGRRCGMKETVELFSFDKHPRRDKDTKENPFKGTLDLDVVQDLLQSFVISRTLTCDIMMYISPRGEVWEVEELADGGKLGNGVAAAGLLDLVDEHLKAVLSIDGKVLCVATTLPNGVCRLHVPLTPEVSGRLLTVQFEASERTAPAEISWQAPVLGIGRKLKAVRTSADAADVVVVLPRATKMSVYLYCTPANVPLPPGGLTVELVASNSGETLASRKVVAGDPFVTPMGWYCHYGHLGKLLEMSKGRKVARGVSVKVKAGEGGWGAAPAGGDCCTPVPVSITPGDDTQVRIRLAVPEDSPRLEEDWAEAALREDHNTLIGYLTKEQDELAQGGGGGDGFAGSMTIKRTEVSGETAAKNRLDWSSTTLFCSSTFNDFHAERNYLSRYVFPLVRSRCLDRRVYFSFVDFRWGGVTEEEGKNSLTVQRCLEMVDRCRINGRKFFLGILGDRYGWMPWTQGDPDAIKLAARKFPWIMGPPHRKGVREPKELSVTALELEHGVLRHVRAIRDANKAAGAPKPPERGGGPRTSNSTRAMSKQKAEAEEAARKAAASKEAPEPLPRAAMMLRTISGDLEGIPKYEHYRFKPLNHQAETLQKGLRRQVQATMAPGAVTEYEAVFTQGSDKKDLFEDGGHKFGLKAFKHIWSLLEEEFPESRVDSLPTEPHERERYRQRAFVSETVASASVTDEKASLSTSKRVDILGSLRDRVMDFVKGRSKEAKGAQLLVLKGVRGSGRTTVLASAASAFEKQQEPLIKEGAAGAGHDSGASWAPRTQLIETLPFFFNPGCQEKPLVYINRELERIAFQHGRDMSPRRVPEAQKVRDLNTSSPGARQLLVDNLTAVAEVVDGPVVFLLDGMHFSTLRMLAAALDKCELSGEKVRMVMTTDAVGASSIEGFANNMAVWEMTPMTDEEQVSVVQGSLEAFGKHMDEKQLAIVLDKEDACHPGYLSLLASEMRLFGVFEGVTQRLMSLPGSLEGLVEDVLLPRLEDEHGAAAVREVMELLVCADKGLTPWEIGRLLPHLTAATLYPLVAALQDSDYLLAPPSISVDQSVCLSGNFVRQILRERYLTADIEVTLHRMCSQLFQGEIDPVGVGAFDRTYARGFQNLPGHATAAGDGELAARVLGRMEFVAIKIREFGVDAYIADVDEAASLLSDEARESLEVQTMLRFREWAELEYSLLLESPERAGRIAMASSDGLVQGEAMRMEEERLFKANRHKEMGILDRIMEDNPWSVSLISAKKRSGVVFRFKGASICELDLAGCRVSAMPSEIGMLNGLTRLVMSSGPRDADRRLKELVYELEQCTELEELLLDGNLLTSLPPCVEKLTKLRVLDLSRNPLVSLPPGLAVLSSLETIGLSGTGVEDISGVDWRVFKGVKSLDLSYNTGLKELPESLIQLRLEAPLWKELMVASCSLKPAAVGPFIEEGILVK